MDAEKKAKAQGVFCRLFMLTCIVTWLFLVWLFLKPLVLKLQKLFYMPMFLEYLYMDVTTLKAFFAVTVTVYR